MILGRVIGSIYATIQHPLYGNRKLMMVEKTAPDGTPGKDYLIAVDTVDAGEGDRVLIVDEGNGARQILGDAKAPIRSVIAGIIDEVSEGV
jgi:ethanolamine utilization protein EutN